ncbi:MAG: hypothetical protein NTY96_00130 [Bacteroidetes bacterium]|nr:hypothetical protein [Bacteroidota bacterium]
MKPVILSLIIALLAGTSAFAQSTNQKLVVGIQKHQPLCIRGFSSMGNIKKELSDNEIDTFIKCIGDDSCVAQLKHDFAHPGKEFAPIAKKLSEETKAILLKSVQFGERPTKCNATPVTK